ncbi:hypothetical protein T05_2359 [Trichinella murrelli]|uniref:Uncharacterized protein n=1 Tax=Trichinella murrelli TaxID=144512 RepID=A0A0V0UKC2_9BILA|nr:hypothetical protein T05_2359 [Trichinella murrelli]
MRYQFLLPLYHFRAELRCTPFTLVVHKTSQLYKLLIVDSKILTKEFLEISDTIKINQSVALFNNLLKI